MTVDRSSFAQMFNRLAVALREANADAAMLGVFYETLKDLSADELAFGADWLAKEGGRKFFPTTAEWREAALSYRADNIRKQLSFAREEPWHFVCNRCEDTGWELDSGRPFECPGDETCGRKNKHAAHTYTRACPCRATNREWQRKNGRVAEQ